jgi:hypothetical protein
MVDTSKTARIAMSVVDERSLFDRITHYLSSSGGPGRKEKAVHATSFAQSIACSPMGKVRPNSGQWLNPVPRSFPEVRVITPILSRTAMIGVGVDDNVPAVKSIGKTKSFFGIPVKRDSA